MMAQDAEGTGSIAKTAGDVSRGKTFDEVGPEGLVLALGGGSGFEEEAGFGGSEVRLSGELSIQQIMILMF